MTTYSDSLERRLEAKIKDMARRLAAAEQQLANLTFGAIPVTSGTHPANPAVGVEILETDTGNTLIWNGSAWVPVQTGAWTSYPVSWTSTGTAPSVGAGGSLVGYYAKTGRRVTVKVALTSGAATNFGSGNYEFSLPFTAAVTGVGSGGFAHAGSWALYNAGNSTFYTANAAILQGIPGQIVGLVAGSANFLGATNPATFSGSGCQLTCTLTYESTT